MARTGEGSGRDTAKEAGSKAVDAEPASTTTHVDSASAGINPTDLVDKPDRPGAQTDGTEGSTLPGVTEPTVADDRSVDSGDTSVTGPTAGYADPVDGVDADPALSKELEEHLEASTGFGGADGRNPASDAGGPTTPAEQSADAGGAVSQHGTAGVVGGGSSLIGNPYASAGMDGSAAGALPPHQQANLDRLKADAFEAAAEGDEGEANRIAQEAADYMVEVGIKEAPPADEGSPPKGPDETAVTGAAPVGYTEGEGVSSGDGMKAVAEDNKGGFLESISNLFSGNETKTPRGEVLTGQEEGEGLPTPPADAPGVTEDRGVESDTSAPDLHRGFTDAYQEHKLVTTLGADVDPDPTADPAGATTGEITTDYEPFVAEYAEGYTPPSEDQITGAMDRVDPIPDEEFFET